MWNDNNNNNTRNNKVQFFFSFVFSRIRDVMLSHHCILSLKLYLTTYFFLYPWCSDKLPYNYLHYRRWWSSDWSRWDWRQTCVRREVHQCPQRLWSGWTGNRKSKDSFLFLLLFHLIFLFLYVLCWITKLPSDKWSTKAQ